MEDATETVPGLTLAEPDFITLALELAVREVPDWRRDPRGAARRGFRIPTARRSSSSSGRRSPPMSPTRDAFFDQPPRREEPRPRDLGARGRSATCTTRCAPRQRRSTSARASSCCARSSSTGDIFFPKRWMDATLSGHQSASAALVVSDFLKGLPKEYPERLRRVILSSADDLMRARRIRER